MIIVDYYNFLYNRYSDINEDVIIKNLHLLAVFGKQKNTVIKVFFDGIFFQDINFSSKQVEVFFSSYQTADECILKMFGSLQGKMHWLVSKDRRFIKMIKYKSNISIVFPEKLWKELDFLLRCKNIQNNKKSNLIKTTDFDDAEIDYMYNKYFNK
jgi:hypothetical protein